MFTSLEELLARIGDATSLALAPDYSGCAMAAVRGLMASQVRDLHLVGVPQMGFQADMLIGAGTVARVETAAVTLGEYGPAPCFNRAVSDGDIQIDDATCPAILAALQASEKGIPFMPLRGIIGSDLLAARSDWKVIDNPFSSNDPLVLLPAIRPDVTLFHASKADQMGNVWVGVRRELVLAAHASRTTLVTVEEVCDGSFLDDPALAAGTLPALYVHAIAEVAAGAWPLGLAGRYEPDVDHLTHYAAQARTREGFAQYMHQHVLTDRAA